MTHTQIFPVLIACLSIVHSRAIASGPQCVRLIYDTDMGNDVDDALALGVIHALADRGECELLAVTVTKDHKLSAPFIDAVNTFYGRSDIPIGVARSGVTPGDSRYLPLAEVRDGEKLRYPHDLRSGADADDAVGILRRVLSNVPDESVTIVQVGASTNLAALLESPADRFADSSGTDLVRRKVKLLSVMAGEFLANEPGIAEYNVRIDLPSARRLVADWPTPIVFSGHEVGRAIAYPAESIKYDFAYVEHHPLSESYQLYRPTPHERPCYDLTSVLFAVRPDRGYFGLSPHGRILIDDDARTSFERSEKGLHRYLLVDQAQAVRARECFAQLVSQPPRSHAKTRD